MYLPIGGAIAVAGSAAISYLARRAFTVPEPFGEYKKIGVRLVRLGPHVRAQVFYPCDENAVPRSNMYFPDGGTPATRGLANFARMPKYGADVLAFTRVKYCDNAAVSDKGPFPTIVFYHGLGGGSAINSQYCMQLASLGNVVWAIESTCGSQSYAKLGDGTELFYHKIPNAWYTHPPRHTSVLYRPTQLRRRLYLFESEILPCLLTPVDQHDPSMSLNPGEVRLDADLQNGMDFSKFFVSGHSFGGACTLAIGQWWVHGGGRALWEGVRGLKLQGLLLQDPWLDCLDRRYVGLERRLGKDLAIYTMNSEMWNQWKGHNWDQFNFLAACTASDEEAQKVLERRRDMLHAEVARRRKEAGETDPSPKSAVTTADSPLPQAVSPPPGSRGYRASHDALTGESTWVMHYDNCVMSKKSVNKELFHCVPDSATLLLEERGAPFVAEPFPEPEVIGFNGIGDPDDPQPVDYTFNLKVPQRLQDVARPTKRHVHLYMTDSTHHHFADIYYWYDVIRPFSAAIKKTVKPQLFTQVLAASTAKFINDTLALAQQGGDGTSKGVPEGDVEVDMDLWIEECIKNSCIPLASQEEALARTKGILSDPNMLPPPRRFADLYSVSASQDPAGFKEEIEFIRSEAKKAQANAERRPVEEVQEFDSAFVDEWHADFPELQALADKVKTCYV